MSDQMALRRGTLLILSLTLLTVAGAASAFDFGRMMNPSRWMGGGRDHDYRDGARGYYPGYGYGGPYGYAPYGYGPYGPGYGGYGYGYGPAPGYGAPAYGRPGQPPQPTAPSRPE